MGLDAIVFRNAQNVAARYDVKISHVDQNTGEVEVAREDAERLPLDGAIAIRRRFGNVEDVARLRSAVGPLLQSPDSIVLGKVLYSTSHSGDVLGVEEFEALQAELLLLQSSASDELRSFFAKMVALIATAEIEHNPMVFV